MIKTVIALFLFAVALCIWIVDPFGTFGGDAVSQFASAPLDDQSTLVAADRLGSEIAHQVAPQVAPRIDVIAAAEIQPETFVPETALAVTMPQSAPRQDVTRGITVVSILPTPEAAASAAATPEPVAEIAPQLDVATQSSAAEIQAVIAASTPVEALQLCTVDTNLSVMMTGILTQLGLHYSVVTAVAVTPAAATQSNDPLALQLAQTLAGIAAITGNTDLGVTVTLQDATLALESIIVKALRAGRSDAQIDDEVNRAAQDGGIAVPGVLVRADGRIDTAVLLHGVLVTARIAQGGAARAAWGAQLSGTDAVVYEVKPADSAAALAMAFYGDPTRAAAIIAANPEILGNGASIAPGQQIIIPQL